MIPNIIHFIYIKGPSFEFNIIHYMAVKSAKLIQKPEKIYMYYSEEPENNRLWDEIKEYVTLEKITPPEEIYGIKITHNAHKADIIRLQKLMERGGIYLDHRKDRLEHITNELKKYNFDPTKIHKINATEIKSNGGKGCSHSHYNAMKYAIENNFSNVMVMEDDFVIKQSINEFYDSIKKILDHDKDWDVIMPFFGMNKMNRRTRKVMNNIYKVSSSLGAYSTLCYCVNRKMMEKLKNNFWESYIKQDDDKEKTDPLYYTDRHWFPLQKRSNWYLIYPHIGTQTPGYSDISLKHVKETKMVT